MLNHLHTLSGHQNPIYALVSSTKPDIFYSAGNDKGVVEWSLDTMAFVKVLVPVQSSVYALHRHDNLLFIGQRSGLITVFDLAQQKIVSTLSHHQKGVFDVKTITSKNEIISTGEDGTVAIWSLSDFSLLYNFPVIKDTVRTIALSIDEKEIALGAKDGIIRVYHSSDYSLIHEISAHTFPVTALQYSPLGNYLISASRDAQLKIWSMPDYREIQNIPAHMFSVYAIVFHPTQPYFATASMDKSIKLWGSDDFKLYKSISREKGYNGHFLSINKIAWNNDNELISLSDDKNIIIWNVQF